MEYYNKYQKYKIKYKNLKKQVGGLFVPFNAPIELKSTIIEEILKNKELINIEIEDRDYYFRIEEGRITGISLVKNLNSIELSNLNSLLKRILQNVEPDTPEIKLQKEYNELLILIKENIHKEIARFIDSLNPDDLFNYIKDMKNTEDHDKTILYYLARQGNIGALRYIKDKIGPERFSYLLSIPSKDNRIVLFGAIDAVINKRATYTFIKENTDPGLYNIRFFHNNGSAVPPELNIKQWAELRNLHKLAPKNDEIKYVYDDICLLLGE